MSFGDSFEIPFVGERELEVVTVGLEYFHGDELVMEID